MYRITIENLSDSESNIVLEYEHMCFEQERGHTAVYDDTLSDSDLPWGKPTELRSNGQHRIKITAWTGCPSYEAFRPMTLSTK